MPISVFCPGCQTRFSVSEKFAGKQGPCPKCRAIIQIPAASSEEVKIHAPEEYSSGGKDSRGRPSAKPIAREVTRFKPKAAAAIGGATLLVFLAAYFGRDVFSLPPLIVVGLAAISPPVVAGGYWFLRNQELEPYRSKSLILRSVLCGAAFGGLWGIYALVSPYITGETWQWLFLAPAFIAVGGGAAFATLDLEFGSAALLYCFYLIVSLLLRAAVGLPPIWEIAA